MADRHLAVVAGQVGVALPTGHGGLPMTTTRRDVALGITASALMLRPAAAMAQAAALIKTLKPGEFVWMPEVSPRGPVVIVVSLPEQLVHVYRNGVTIGVSTCSTGKTGNRTPTGVFTILQKRQEHYSSTYNNAPMPNMQRLTWQGVALHAGNLPGYPASHGCIRLPMDFSKLLFTVTDVGTAVVIADQATAFSSVVRPDLVLPKEIADAAEAAQEKVVPAGRRPATATEPVMSVLVSGGDRKAYLMVDGDVTYETPISVFEPEKPLGTHLFSLIGPSQDRLSLRWAAFGLGGRPQAGVPVDLWSNSVLARIDYLDFPGVRRVAQTLKPGTTMIITDLAASPDTRSAPDFTVIVEDKETAGRRRKS
jgi:hypothetical protein